MTAKKVDKEDMNVIEAAKKVDMVETEVTANEVKWAKKDMQV